MPTVRHPRRAGTTAASPPSSLPSRHADRKLDGTPGALVLDEADATTLGGHLDDATFRERAEDFAAVPDGCTTHAQRVTFRFTRTR